MPPPAKRNEETMKKTLIVYHSRTGHTRRVAQALASRLDDLPDHLPHEGRVVRHQNARHVASLITRP